MLSESIKIFTEINEIKLTQIYDIFNNKSLFDSKFFPNFVVKHIYKYFNSH